VSKRARESRERESSINQISFHESSSVSIPRAPQLKCPLDSEERFLEGSSSRALSCYIHMA
jgi:hypothetical protein